MKITLRWLFSFILVQFLIDSTLTQSIPLPEHPRPDFERAMWQNLNGQWAFEFDSLNTGIKENWIAGNRDFSKTITVPYPWGSKLSGVADEADIGWYQRTISVNQTWKGKKIYLTVGASDWETSIWIDGHFIGKHQGGYTPFSFDCTEYIHFGKKQKLVIRVDDKRRAFTLYGKQGYGNARGIWQTIYLEARPEHHIDAVHFIPNIDEELVNITLYLDEIANEDLPVSVFITTEDGQIQKDTIFPDHKLSFTFDIPIPDATLWSLENPYLYETSVKLKEDEVNSYFGMRKISVTKLPGTEYSYVALNNEPIYLQLALDQSYHPEGYYTFPSDQFIKEEIERSKSIGLNGIRPHIKVEIPRKLYWADKLGLLVMQDLPNSWGEPDELMQAESEYTLREMIKRDFNHPSIFSWVIFNETWGLNTKVIENGKPINRYLPKTQYWVSSMYYLAKSLDQTRLVEDNSICCGRGHTETDIASFHDYLPGWLWDDKLSQLSATNSYYGNPSLFEEGFSYQDQPIINSECGNVWGYSGSTGDVDWSWDYHRMMNSFRMYPKIAGWLYTEHHDVINEWNGYWRFDRSEKTTGLNNIVPGMSLLDFHSPIYLSNGNEISYTVSPGEEVTIPLILSSMTSKNIGDSVFIHYTLEHINQAAFKNIRTRGIVQSHYSPWMQEQLKPLQLKMADSDGLSKLSFLLKDVNGNVLHRNFIHFIIDSGDQPKDQISSKSPNAYSKASWSQKYWNVMNGKKLNGTGKGYFEYEFDIPKELNHRKITSMHFLAELSAKKLLVKDTIDSDNKQFNFMLGDVAASSRNKNAYPMTDELLFPSEVFISIDGKSIQTLVLPDDPADHRGVLSWHSQLEDKKLREAGSYGYLVKVPLDKSQIRNGIRNGKITIRIETKAEGGIAVYGKSFGQYPIDPSIIWQY